MFLVLDATYCEYARHTTEAAAVKAALEQAGYDDEVYYVARLLGRAGEVIKPKYVKYPAPKTKRKASPKRSKAR